MIGTSVGFASFRFRDGERQHTVAEFGFDVVRFHFRWEREFPLEVPITSLDSAIVLGVVNLFLPLFPTECQEVIFDRNVEIVFCDSGEFSANFKVVICF